MDRTLSTIRRLSANMFRKVLSMFRNSAKPYLVIFVLFTMVCLLMLVSIIYWWVSTARTKHLIDTIQTQEVVGVPESPKTTLTPNKPKEFPFIEADFTELKKRNPDTVAWLKVDAVNMSIPIVQTTDNEYYLDHDLDKNPNKLGWVFADVRSNMEHLGMNTVLYGHNALNLQMFGSLKELLNTDPEKKEQNEVIQMTTPFHQMVFQIVSVYVTDYEDWKYVNQIFTGNDTRQEFIDRMRQKNEVKMFDRTDLSVMDKFLTFSTCYGPVGTTKRLVVHARLVAEK